ncbi:hypothetical protein LXL04_008765 [Taraxacum kok-saghyz]
MVLEEVASQDLWFWHTYFGLAGSNNDLNILQVSSVFDHILKGSAPDTSFEVNGTQFQHGYYLFNGIYHDWAVFVKKIQYSDDAVRERYKGAQERARKDMERAFEPSKNKYVIILGQTRKDRLLLWDGGGIKYIERCPPESENVVATTIQRKNQTIAATVFEVYFLSINQRDILVIYDCVCVSVNRVGFLNWYQS